MVHVCVVREATKEEFIAHERLDNDVSDEDIAEIPANALFYEVVEKTFDLACPCGFTSSVADEYVTHVLTTGHAGMSPEALTHLADGGKLQGFMEVIAAIQEHVSHGTPLPEHMELKPIDPDDPDLPDEVRAWLDKIDEADK